MTAPVPAVSRSRAAAVQLIPFGDGQVAWLVEDYAVPVVAMAASIAGGATQDPAGRAGAANLMASLLDEGAGEFDDVGFHRALDDAAIEFSASGDRDMVQVKLRTLARHLDRAEELAALALNAPRFDEAPTERVRAHLLSNLKREANDPDARAGRAWRAAAFEGHVYAEPINGSLETLPAVTRSDLVALREATFARDGLHVALVGALDAARARRLLDALFGGWAATGARRATPDVSVGGGGRRILIDIDVPQTTLRFGAAGVPRHDPDFEAATLVNHIFGGGVFSARLFKEVRETRGLAYSVWTQLMVSDHAALALGGTSTKNDRAAEAIAVIEAELAKMAQDGPTEEELAKAKSYLTGSYDLRFDSSSKIAAALLQVQRDGFAPDYLDQRNPRLAAVTLEQARRVALRLFGQPMLWAIAGRPQGVDPA